LQWLVDSITKNSQARGSPLVGCRRLLIRWYICSYHLYQDVICTRNSRERYDLITYGWVGTNIFGRKYHLGLSSGKELKYQQTDVNLTLLEFIRQVTEIIIQVCNSTNEFVERSEDVMQFLCRSCSY
jgi:hypothetical protein